MPSFSRTLAHTVTWHFDSPPEAVWPALADTARFNEAAGLPKHAIEERPQPDGSSRFFGRARKGPFDLAWEEIPIEFVEAQWFRHLRIFSAGPLASLCASVQLRPDGRGGSIADYTVEAAPRTLIGWMLLRTGFFGATERIFTAVAKGVGDWAAGRAARPFTPPAAPLQADTRRRLDALVARIEASPNAHGLTRRLADWILAAQEIDIERIRPLALAREWDALPRHVVELCLQSTRDGLLEMSWDLLCPRCRGAKAKVASLDRLPTGTHCPACNIDFGRDFARNVELTFRPAPGIRAVVPGEFCLFGPMTTPHVRIQVALAPGETRRIDAALSPGDYRLRTLEAGGEADFGHDGGPVPALAVVNDGVELGEPTGNGITLVSRAAEPRTVVVESRDWVQDALTAHRVTTLQTFRELFAGEVLRPGDDVGIAHVTLMFTDVKSSTALYERVGDSAAYRIVRDHFAYLAQTVRRADGAVVKTIGDSIMAAFASPADAVRAALATQAGIAAFNEQVGGTGLVIRLGIHAGPTIAVTLNDRLDYFGTTVNLAARLEAESLGGDVVLSEAVAEDPGAATLLAGQTVRHERRMIRGFDRPVGYLRLTPASPP